MFLKMGRRISSFEAHNSFEWRRNNLFILTKVLHKRITSGIVMIGHICKKAADRMPNLIERHHKSDWIADIFFCQISTNNFSTIRSNPRHNLRQDLCLSCTLYLLFNYSPSPNIFRPSTEITIICQCLIFLFGQTRKILVKSTKSKTFVTAQDVSRELLYSGEAQLSDQLT